MKRPDNKEVPGATGPRARAADLPGAYRSVRRAALYLLPAVLAAVLVGVLFVGSPGPYAFARVYGGPVIGVDQVSFQVAVLERHRGRDTPKSMRSLRVELSVGKHTHSKTVDTDAFGEAAVAFQTEQPIQGPVELRIAHDALSSPLAAGVLELTPETWRARAISRGGWLKLKAAAPFRIRVAVQRGFMVVPFSGNLVVRVDEAEAPLSAARVTVLGDGLVPLGPTEARTDSSGTAVLSLKPVEHVVDFRVRVELPDGRHGTASGVLPVKPGALNVSEGPGYLVIESPVRRERAYVALVTRAERIWGQALPLSPVKNAGSRGELALPFSLHEPAWLMASSEIGLSSPAAAGFPLNVGRRKWATTFTVPDRLLLDGALAGKARSRENTRRVRALVVSIALLLFTAVALLMLDRFRRAEAEFERHLARFRGPGAVDGRILNAGRSKFVLALVLVALGFAIVTLVALFRLG